MPFVACVSRGYRMIQASVDQAAAPSGPGGACGSPSRAPQARRAPALWGCLAGLPRSAACTWPGLVDSSWAADRLPPALCRFPHSCEKLWHIRSWQSLSQAKNHSPRISQVLTHVMGLVGDLQSFFFSIYEIVQLPMASGPLSCLLDASPIKFPWSSLSSLEIWIFMCCFGTKDVPLIWPYVTEFVMCL